MYNYQSTIFCIYINYYTVILVLYAPGIHIYPAMSIPKQLRSVSQTAVAQVITWHLGWHLMDPWPYAPSTIYALAYLLCYI